LSGKFEGANIDFDPGVGNTLLTSDTTYWRSDGFIAKYSSAGDLLWVFSIGDNDYDGCYGITIDHSNNLIVAGQFSGASVDFDPSPAIYNLTSNTNGGSFSGFLAKYSSTGALLWAFSLNGNPSSVYINSSGAARVSVDDINNILVSGIFDGTIDFDPSPTNSANLTRTAGGSILTSTFIAKYGSNGNYKWAKELPTTVSWVHEINATTSGDFYLSSTLGSNIDIDLGPDTVLLNNYGGYDGFVAKFDSSCNYIWSIVIGGSSYDFLTMSDIDPSGNIWVVGVFMDSVDFDPDTGVSILTSSANSADGFIAKYSSSGTYQWATDIGAGNTAIFKWIDADNNGNIYATGFFQGDSVDFDPDTGTTLLNSLPSEYENFLVRYSPCALPGSPINVTSPSNMMTCSGGNTMLTATGTNLSWYSDFVGGVYLGIVPVWKACEQAYLWQSPQLSTAMLLKMELSSPPKLSVPLTNGSIVTVLLLPFLGLLHKVLLQHRMEIMP
jgi:hypothetical protein